ncbi:MAG TPA: hypothetical protein VES66_08045 [Terriglobales bacterium]|nr:hypothetical protein [Terriglobales bacterium]
MNEQLRREIETLDNEINSGCGCGGSSQHLEQQRQAKLAALSKLAAQLPEGSAGSLLAKSTRTRARSMELLRKANRNMDTTTVVRRGH